MEAMAQAVKRRVEIAEREYLNSTAPYELRMEDKHVMTYVPKIQSKSIDFIKTDSIKPANAISGPIQCDKGFKVRFDLRVPS